MEAHNGGTRPLTGVRQLTSPRESVNVIHPDDDDDDITVDLRFDIPVGVFGFGRNEGRRTRDTGILLSAVFCYSKYKVKL